MTNACLNPATLHTGDNLAYVRAMEAESVDLVLTSPPYNIGKEYETILPMEEYLEQQRQLITELHRVLKSTGTICWQVGYNKDLPLEYLFYPEFAEAGFTLYNRVVWYSRHGFEAKKQFSKKHEVVLFFAKSKDYNFNLDGVRVPSRYPNKKSTRSHNKGEYTCNPLGKNPDDVWEFMQQEWEEGIWNFSRVKHGHGEKTAHPCQFPIELAERCILATTGDGDTVFDPHCGSGTTVVAALKNGRSGIGCDKEQKYIDIAKDRLLLLVSGELPYKPITPATDMNGAITTQEQVLEAELLQTHPPEWFNAEYAAITQTHHENLLRAKALGDALVAKKAELGHGKWLPWVRENLHFSEDTASNYMELASEWEQISNSEALRNMPVTVAVKQLRQQKKKQPPTSQPESTQTAPDESNARSIAHLPEPAPNNDLDDVLPVEEAVEYEPNRFQPGFKGATCEELVTYIGELETEIDEIHRLKHRNELLEQQLAQLKVRNAKLLEGNQKRDEHIAELQLEQNRLLAQNTQLRSRITELESNQPEVKPAPPQQDKEEPETKKPRPTVNVDISDARNGYTGTALCTLLGIPNSTFKNNKSQWKDEVKFKNWLTEVDPEHRDWFLSDDGRWHERLDD